MDWLGALVLIGFSILIVTIILNTCGSYKEGFSRGPTISRLPASPAAYSEVTSLPSAPFTELAAVPRPAYDPSYPRTLIPQIVELKFAMDGFYEMELPYINSGDSAVQLPISEFKGDYETVKAELLFLQANPSNPPNLKVQDIDRMGKNLRALQKVAHTVVPEGMVEGFTSSSTSASTSLTPSASTSFMPSKSSSTFISFAELQTLSLKLQVEIARLQASGTTDPVMQARINVFTQMKQSVDSLISQVKNNTLDPNMIPITQQDYAAFLPSLGANSAGMGGALFKNGMPTLSSLFNNYQSGDISGAQLAETLFNKFSDGLSYNMSVSYTSPNEVTKEVAKSLYRGEFQGKIAALEQSMGDGFTDGTNTDGANANANGTNVDAKAEQDPFDWKKRTIDVCSAIGRMGLDPGDFGCLSPSTQVSPEYSWRGHAKMVCTRAATASDPGLPEQIGCPPVSWPGWRS